MPNMIIHALSNESRFPRTIDNIVFVENVGVVFVPTSDIRLHVKHFSKKRLRVIVTK